MKINKEHLAGVFGIAVVAIVLSILLYGVGSAISRQNKAGYTVYIKRTGNPLGLTYDEYRTARMAYWDRNKRSELAEEAGISRKDLSEILHRKRGVSVRRAIMLSDAAEVLGLDIPLLDWLKNRTTKHPAFLGDSV